jgi:microcystin-dependent protein
MEVFIGTIMMFGGNFAPQGWAMCNGQLLGIAQNQALFSILGTMYGGDGRQTFGLPNLQGRAAIGMGTLPGGSTYVEGQTGGFENVTMTTNQLPSHSHTAMAQSGYAGATAPNNAYLAQLGSATHPSTTDVYTSSGSTSVAMAQGMIAPTGGNQPLGVMQPYMAMNFIIALFGIYPSRG